MMRLRLTPVTVSCRDEIVDHPLLWFALGDLVGVVADTHEGKIP